MMNLLSLHPFVDYDELVPTSRSDQSHEVIDTPKEFRISVDVPGVKASDIQLSVKDDVILMEAVRRRVSSDGSTVKKVKITKSFRVDPQAVDLGNVTANLSDGVLVVLVPKATKPGPRTIAITTNPHTTSTEHVVAEKENEQKKEVLVETVNEKEEMEAERKKGGMSPASTRSSARRARAN